ncbi:MAG: universal stress protein [Methanobacteriota archaeon]
MARILVGFDGSDASRKALEYAATARSASEIVVVNVVPSQLADKKFMEMLLPGIDLSRVAKGGSFKENAKRSIEDAIADLSAKMPEHTSVVIRQGDPADEILAAAKEKACDEIVLGFKSYEKKQPFFIGSVAEKVMRYADRTVTIVR